MMTPPPPPQIPICTQEDRKSPASDKGRDLKVRRGYWGITLYPVSGKGRLD